MVWWWVSPVTLFPASSTVLVTDSKERKPAIPNLYNLWKFPSLSALAAILTGARPEFYCLAFSALKKRPEVAGKASTTARATYEEEVKTRRFAHLADSICASIKSIFLLAFTCRGLLIAQGDELVSSSD